MTHCKVNSELVHQLFGFDYSTNEIFSVSFPFPFDSEDIDLVVSHISAAPDEEVSLSTSQSSDPTKMFFFFRCYKILTKSY